MSEQSERFKSSYSEGECGNRPEVALVWRTSTYSDSEGNNCVQAAPCPAAMHIRDSKLSADSPQLAFPAGPWAAFLAYAIDGAAH
ncbi:DUF397 domain-containing protein [Streptomyces sp. NBC_01013]|uniref:DUF397 domain-containing protein n=1 Tax=Streptomyces sp. NBC_01013 TaxID=2903718 RepID=UPI0038692974|nr:DUF397 domain-containing protein [Streptomyces sp. NBC_01013]